MNDHYRSCH